uniref:Uncharacterized protein n=1 Tax=Caenorhabditis japonica TaxID=281687 RepID=A0A8R1E8P9_CAEJA
MRWSFSKVDLSQQTMYSMLPSFSSMGKKPILFPASNSSADYTSNNWMDPCYERFYEMDAAYIVYWIVKGDVCNYN